MVNKLILRKYLETIDIPDGNINNAISYLLELQREYTSKRYSELALETSYSYEDKNVDLWGSREETDEEFESRIQREKKAREKNAAYSKKTAAKERAEYERLKKKFGD